MKKLLNTAMVAALSTIHFTSPVLAEGGGSSSVCSQNVPDAVKEAAGCSGVGGDQFTNVIQNILYTIIGVLGIVAVIYIIIGGINYMTSSGEPGKVKKARDTILYAVIGLIVCVLAFAIVNFVINGLPG